MPTNGGDFGDPGFSLLRAAFEAYPGAPPRTGYHDIDFSGETFGNTAASLERANISRAGMKPAPLFGKTEPGGDYSCDSFNVQQNWFEVAAFMRRAADPVEVETGAFRHRFSALESDIIFPATFSLLGWRNDDMAQRFPGCRSNSLEISWAERQLVGLTHGAVPLGGDYWDDPTRPTGTGTVYPILTGLNELNFYERAGVAVLSTAATIWIKIISQTATHVTFKAKVGDASTYDGADQVAAKGIEVKTWLRDENDARIGDRALKLEIRFPTGTYVPDDEFKFLSRRGEWVPSFVDDTVIAQEVHSFIYIDGEETEIESGSLALTKNVEAKYGVGGRLPRRTRTRGSQSVTVQLSREYMDLVFRKKLELGKPFGLKLEIFSGVEIGTTGELFYGLTAHMPHLIATGKPATAENATTSNEAITATAHPSSDPSYPADVTLEILNDIPDLEAA